MTSIAGVNGGTALWTSFFGVSGRSLCPRRASLPCSSQSSYWPGYTSGSRQGVVTDAVVVELATIRAKQDSLVEQTKVHQEEINVIKNGINSLNMTCSSMGNQLANVAQTLAKLNDNVSEFGRHWLVEKKDIEKDLHELRIHEVSQDSKLESLKLELSDTTIKARRALHISTGIFIAFSIILIAAKIFGAEAAGKFAAGISQTIKH